METRELRLPLSLGVSCLTDLAVGVIAIPLGLVLAAVAIDLVYEAGWEIGEGFEVVVGMVVAGVGMTIVGARSTRRAWGYRPSDLLLGDEGIRIEGGDRHKFSSAWPTISNRGSDVLTENGGVITVAGLANSLLGDNGDTMLHRFRIGGDVLAETDDEREAGSFREIAAALSARAHPERPAADVAPAPAPAPAPEPPTRRGKPRRGREAADPAAPASPPPEVAVVSCGECGGTVSPGAEAEVSCPHCQAKVAIPAELRERVRAAANLSVQARRAERIVTRMLDQPSATQTTAWISGSTLFIAAAWPITAWAFFHLEQAHRLEVGIGALVALLPFLLVADGFFLSRLRLVDRLALRSLTLSFGARAPARVGDPLECRACLAPLPTATTTVIECVYCGAANVTRVDLRSRASRTESSAQSLEAELAKHAEERAWWRTATVAGVACFAATGYLLHQVW